MTTKEFLKLMDRAKKEVYEEYKIKGNTFSLKDIEVIMNRAKQEEDLDYLRKLNKIRDKAYELNKEVGFYGIAGMDYDDFLKAIQHYSYEERMRIAYAFLQHIELLDNIIFEESEG